MTSVPLPDIRGLALWFPRLVVSTVLDRVLGPEEQLYYVSTCHPRQRYDVSVPDDGPRAAITYSERKAA